MKNLILLTVLMTCSTTLWATASISTTQPNEINNTSFNVLQQKIVESQQLSQNQIKQVQANLQQEINNLNTQLQTKIKQTQTELQQQIAQLQQQINKLGTMKIGK